MDLPARYTPTGDEFTGGGMSDAIVCNDEHLERLVLVKKLQSGVDQSRILDEIAALTTIRSKHVVELFDVLRDDDGEIVGIVEDYLPGDDLNAILPIKDRDTFLKTAYAISCGISDIHERGRVHRDIKPSNMKFDAESCLKIFDFGLSRPDDLDAKTIGTVGTPGYLAPELCVDEWEEVKFSQPVDVYAFGATAVKMLFGKLPPELRKLPPTLPCHAADFGKHPIALPKPIADTLNACLTPNPDDRPPMKVVRDTLAAHLLRNQHRATVVLGNTVHTLDSKNPAANITAGSLGSVQLKYDGLHFIVSGLSGTVTINNIPVKVDQALPGACVITLGDPSVGWNRKYVTVNVSHPEVVL
jgi:serine/threonine protein kinase